MLGAYNIDSDDEEEEEEVLSNIPKSASTHIQELEKVIHCLHWYPSYLVFNFFFFTIYYISFHFISIKPADFIYLWILHFHFHLVLVHRLHQQIFYLEILQNINLEVKSWNIAEVTSKHLFLNLSVFAVFRSNYSLPLFFKIYYFSIFLFFFLFFSYCNIQPWQQTCTSHFLIFPYNFKLIYFSLYVIFFHLHVQLITCQRMSNIFIKIINWTQNIEY